MTSYPDCRVRVAFSHIGVEFTGSGIVPALLMQGLGDTSVVARVRARRTIANLMPSPLPLLCAATTEEQVIVNFVIGCCTVTVEHGGGRSLETNDNGGVIVVSPDVSAQAVTLPAKIRTAVEGVTNI